MEDTILSFYTFICNIDVCFSLHTQRTALLFCLVSATLSANEAHTLHPYSPVWLKPNIFAKLATKAKSTELCCRLPKYVKCMISFLKTH